MRAPKERLLWLDLARVLSAAMILGFHWLRSGYKLGLVGPRGFNLIMSYQWNTQGFALFHDVFIAGFDPKLTIWLTNIVGLLGGFGWEAVNAFIVFSGFSLALSQGNRSLSWREWLLWYRKRAARVLVPFYTVAIPCLVLVVLALVGLQHVHTSTATLFQAKVDDQLNGPLLGVVASHILLFDPLAQQGTASFFVPAWWFVPAIALAYLTYPLVWRASRYRHGIPLLLLSGIITIGSYIATDARVFLNEAWYFIVLNESFNFSLGVAAAGAWLGAGRPAIERALESPRALIGALALFVLGNLCNWRTETRPIASMLFGPSLAFALAFLGNRLQAWNHANKLLTVDPYDLYLVHQPFAFPIALVASKIFHGYALFFGWFIFVALASAAAHVLGDVQHALSALPTRLRSRFPIFARRTLAADEGR